MSRYKETNISKKEYKNSKEKNSFQKYSTTMYKRIPLRDNDLYILTQGGDRLDKLAFQFYGDSRLWWYIAQANHLKTMNVEDGVSLRIPSTTDFASTE